MSKIETWTIFKMKVSLNKFAFAYNFLVLSNTDLIDQNNSEWNWTALWKITYYSCWITLILHKFVVIDFAAYNRVAVDSKYKVKFSFISC